MRERIRQSLKLTKHVPQLEALCSAPEELAEKAQGCRIYLLLQPAHAARTGMLVAVDIVKWGALSLMATIDCFVAGKITGMLLDHFKDPSEVPYA
jgi:hypothetical protein